MQTRWECGLRASAADVPDTDSWLCTACAPQDVAPEAKSSMLVVSEFVGCSPSVSGAIRVNPWSIDSLADGIYTAIKASPVERHLRHDKHWRYVSQHTVRFWAQVRPLRRLMWPSPALA